jgi:glucan biosynthesis protein C
MRRSEPGAMIMVSITASRGGDMSALDTTATRLHYIDWLRVLAVLLLFPYHVTRVFNEEAFYVKADEVSAALNVVLGFVSVWHMPLLFVLAGASTYFALRRRGSREYLDERFTRLGVPFLIGVFVLLIPVQTWYGARFNSGYTESFWHYLVSGDFLRWNIQEGGDYFGGFGFGHLWFIFVLLLVAVIALPLLANRGRGDALLGGLSRRLARPVMWPLAALLVYAGEALPDPTGALTPFYYLVFFVLGYVVVCDPAFLKAAEQYRLPALATGVLLAAFWVLTPGLRDALPDPSLQLTALNLLGAAASWLVIVGLLGYGRRYLDRTTPALSYLGEASYPVYLLHQTVIVIAAFYVVDLAAAEPLQWLTLMAVSVAATFALYEVVRRTRVTRWAFGMKVGRPAGTKQPDAAGRAPGVVAS